jgi:hypothetical protein
MGRFYLLKQKDSLIVSKQKCEAEFGSKTKSVMQN